MWSVFYLRVLISLFNWVILTVLKEEMAMAAIDMPIAMNRFGLPGRLLGQRFDNIAEIFQRSFNDCQADIGNGFCD